MDVANILRKLCNFISWPSVSKGIYENISKIVKSCPDYLQMLIAAPENLVKIAEAALNDHDSEVKFFFEKLKI